jgi:hypothetical protein
MLYHRESASLIITVVYETTLSLVLYARERERKILIVLRLSCR